MSGDSMMTYVNRVKSPLDKLTESSFTSARTLSDLLRMLTKERKKDHQLQNCNRGWLNMWELLQVHDLAAFA